MELWDHLKEGLSWVLGFVGAICSALWWFGKRTIVKLEVELKELKRTVIELDKRQAIAESHINNIKEAIERVEESIQKSEENIKMFIRDLLKVSK